MEYPLEIEALQKFRLNTKRVEQLMNFDSTLINVSVALLREHSMQWAGMPKLQTQKNVFDSVINTFENRRKDPRFKEDYQSIFNQCIVLLVSYFASSLAELYRENVLEAIATGVARGLLELEVKIKVHELATLDRSSFGDVLIEKNSISFQDMQSIKRAFKEAFQAEVNSPQCQNNIIAAQAFRHIIVHNGNIVDDRLLRQLQRVSPRDLKKSVKKGDSVEFDLDEVKLVISNMDEYLTALCAQVENARVG